MAKKPYYQIRNKALKYNYGITFEGFQDLLLKQNSSCGICNDPFTDKYPRKPCVDHIHDKDETIRGLLCSKCNTAIGFFGDNTKTMEAAIKWLENEGFKYTKVQGPIMSPRKKDKKCPKI